MVNVFVSLSFNQFSLTLADPVFLWIAFILLSNEISTSAECSQNGSILFDGSAISNVF
jgi:hypothetical protein